MILKSVMSDAGEYRTSFNIALGQPYAFAGTKVA